MAAAGRIRAGGDLPLLRGAASDAELTDRLLAPMFEQRRAWWIAFAICAAGTLLLFALIAYTLATGIGVWGNNIPVAWGVSIINFVWWGHAGAFISAVLLLTKQPGRPGIGRITESMALFSLAISGIFPLLHLGRPWLFYWMIPYPSSLGVWPQYLSGLTWDMIGILTLLVVSLLFWYVGLIPDLAEVRDCASGKLRRRIYGVFALGWKGSAWEWHVHRQANGLLAGLVVAAATTMHSVASMDFATALIPGWHSTIFPPAFLARGIYSGLCLALLLVLLVRRTCDLGSVLTPQHLDVMARAILALGWAVLYTTVFEVFTSWCSGSEFRRYTYLVERPAGTFALTTWITLGLVLLTPQLFWSRRARRSPPVLAAGAALILAGLWMERFLIVSASLSQDFLPSAWHEYIPGWVEWGILAGALSLFGLLFLLLVRFVPLVSASELKGASRTLPRGRPDDG